MSKTNLASLFLATLIGIGLHQVSIADTPKHAIGYSAVTTSSPHFSLSTATRIAWLLEDVSLNKDAPISDKYTRQILHEEITNIMQEKGLSLLNSGSKCDYYIAYTVASESTLDDETLLKRYNISPGFNAPASGRNVYEKGTLLIHFINANTRQTVWQSVVQANIHSKLSDDQRRANIRAVVRSMLGQLKVKA